MVQITDLVNQVWDRVNRRGTLLRCGTSLLNTSTQREYAALERFRELSVLLKDQWYLPSIGASRDNVSIPSRSQSVDCPNYQVQSSQRISMNSPPPARRSVIDDTLAPLRAIPPLGITATSASVLSDCSEDCYPRVVVSLPPTTSVQTQSADPPLSMFAISVSELSSDCNRSEDGYPRCVTVSLPPATRSIIPQSHTLQKINHTLDKILSLLSETSSPLSVFATSASEVSNDSTYSEDRHPPFIIVSLPPNIDVQTHSVNPNDHRIPKPTFTLDNGHSSLASPLRLVTRQARCIPLATRPPIPTKPLTHSDESSRQPSSPKDTSSSLQAPLEVVSLKAPRTEQSPPRPLSKYAPTESFTQVIEPLYHSILISGIHDRTYVRKKEPVPRRIVKIWYLRIVEWIKGVEVACGTWEDRVAEVERRRLEFLKLARLAYLDRAKERKEVEGGGRRGSRKGERRDLRVRFQEAVEVLEEDEEEDVAAKGRKGCEEGSVVKASES